ncbi:hypothetical protein [Mucilaginibacter terrae]|uniref:Nucleoside-triphosphatase THEP1 n=1 Tax=Mucilaginibacter terrae TaxID=1955052 RepID=A0ABU3GWX6_9SPHI|nr:hypothetical protein [Mucilaginibacter terrae]MDT3404267.1 nucleoside-triphosphatase THEP1 [Mucilaginibacter terrae]
MEIKKSKYELMLESILSKSKPVVFTPEQNDKIIQDLNKGMDDFLHEQRVIEKESEMELAGIVLNA